MFFNHFLFHLRMRICMPNIKMMSTLARSGSRTTASTWGYGVYGVSLCLPALSGVPQTRRTLEALRCLKTSRQFLAKVSTNKKCHSQWWPCTVFITTILFITSRWWTFMHFYVVYSFSCFFPPHLPARLTTDANYLLANSGAIIFLLCGIPKNKYKYGPFIELWSVSDEREVAHMKKQPR